jgi:acyl-[acyl carrier protein]--UDP-N-acetylglucosamine O-acyltransferase
MAELVFNLDEAGISDWEDRKTKTVPVPATMGGQTILHEISRTVKHISMISCVSAAEESVAPYVIISQARRRSRSGSRKKVFDSVRISS